MGFSQKHEVTSLNKDVGKVGKIIMQHKIRIHHWQCSKGLHILGPNLIFLKFFCQSLKMKHERSEEKVGTVGNVFFSLWKLSFSFSLFSVPKKTKDLFEGQQHGFWKRDFRRKERE